MLKIRRQSMSMNLEVYHSLLLAITILFLLFVKNKRIYIGFIRFVNSFITLVK
jgi:hypothetical protein